MKPTRLQRSLLFLRTLAVLPIKVYRLCISPVLPAACRFYPTCSAYAQQAVLRHGILYGTFLALQRLARCHPWSPGGYDPVPSSRTSRFSGFTE